jgi:hypothetical protein
MKKVSSIDVYLMYTKNKLSLCEIEDLIQQLAKKNDIWATWKLWLLFADIHYRSLWKYGRYGSFVNYVKIEWGHQSCQAYKLIKAGCTLELLLNHPEFESSGLSLPDTLESAVSLGRHPDVKIFGMWRDWCEEKIPISKTSENARVKSSGNLKIQEALENLNRLDAQ